MQLLRIEKGYTYGAGSFVGAYINDASPWVAYTNVRSNVTLNAKAGLLSRIALQNLPHDIVEQETAVLQSMDTADFQETIADHLDESEMIWLIVGDAATQLERLKDFDYGEPVVLDVQGNRLSTSRHQSPGAD